MFTECLLPARHNQALEANCNSGSVYQHMISHHGGKTHTFVEYKCLITGCDKCFEREV